jgi:hypothetical protein
MKRKILEPALLGLLLVGLFVFAVSQLINRTGAPMAENKSYSTDLNDLRAKFNQDKGRVRLLLLLSPT